MMSGFNYTRIDLKADSSPARCRCHTTYGIGSITYTRYYAAVAFVLAGTILPVAAQAIERQAAVNLTLVRRQQLVFRHALEVVSPAIVRIDTIGGAQPVQQEMNAMQQQRVTAGFRQADGSTTGVIWSADGYIITSSFNFVRDPVVITVRLADGRRFVAELIVRDAESKLALIKIDAADLPVPRWIEREVLQPGQWVLAAGWGYDSDQPAISVGILSASSRMSGRAVQTDAKISPANYGGPLFDIEGRVIGICVPMGLSEDELAGVEWYDSGIGFAIIGKHIRRRMPRLMSGQDLQRGLLGINLDPRETVVGEQAETGLRIIGEPRGPAAEAGLQTGDLIVRIDGAPTPRIVDFKRMIARKAAGDTVTVDYTHEGMAMSAILTLASPEDFRAIPTSKPN